MLDRVPDIYRSAELLEQHFGDPMDDGSPFSFRRVLDFDEQEQFPAAILDHVHAANFNRYIIPPELGGSFDTCEGQVARHRAIARRDFSVDIALSAAYLTFLPVWCGGSEAQKARFAKLFIEQRELAALALTERDHGADLVSTETVAAKVPGGWSITGEKWLINNASRGRIVCVLAKTAAAGSRPGLSLFMVDKDLVARDSYEHLPKVRLHGTRGMDLCGIRFQACEVADEALVGVPGNGLELVLKGMALSRTSVTGRSIAAADTALRLTLDFARARRLYGDSVLAISHAKHQLAYAFADLLLCDTILVGAARALHVCPQQATLTAAITKYLVPTLSERIIAETGVILGARNYLREEHWHGVFQKVRRDNELISVFDGSTIVNLSAIASQLGALSVGRREGARDDTKQRIKAVFTLDHALPRFDLRAIELSCRGRNDVLAAVGGLAGELEGLRGRPEVSRDALEELIRLESLLRTEIERLEAHLHAGFHAGWATKHRSAAAIELARRYCVLHGVASGLHGWLGSRHLVGGAYARGEWLAIAGHRMLAQLVGVGDPNPRVDVNGLADEMMRLFDARRAFAMVPYQLA